MAEAPPIEVRALPAPDGAQADERGEGDKRRAWERQRRRLRQQDPAGDGKHDRLRDRPCQHDAVAASIEVDLFVGSGARHPHSFRNGRRAPAQSVPFC